MDTPNKKTQLIATLLEKFKEENEEFLNYAVPNIFSKKLGSLMLIREDILLAKDAVNKLIEFKQQRIDEPQTQPDEIIESSLWYSTIIQYGHCYTENKGGHSRLEVNEIFTLPADQAHKDTHDEIMELRHSFVAHRDDTEYEQAVVVMQVPKAGGDDDKIRFGIKSAKTFSPSIDNLSNYIQLFDFLLPKIDEKIQKQADKTRDGLFKNLDASQINHLLIR